MSGFGGPKRLVLLNDAFHILVGAIAHIDLTEARAKVVDSFPVDFQVMA